MDAIGSDITEREEAERALRERVSFQHEMGFVGELTKEDETKPDSSRAMICSAGAAVYVLKSAELEELSQAIHHALEGLA